ncbi:hypothetical protein IFM89_025408 [Coptis chinensis]|uniref:Uncharacterized protein n=1 Tax=Coptis chinensis TaxID=261450 RepID=A0A835LFN7_9MAGN|nr:hypothetical protein IFM89_025408 [Coptis chinensis]
MTEMGQILYHMEIRFPRPGKAWTRKNSVKARFCFVTTTGITRRLKSFVVKPTHDHLHEVNVGRSSSICSSSIGIFTHAVPIKCLVTGLLGFIQ